MKIIDKRTIAKYLVNYISTFSLEEIENTIEIPPNEINFAYAFPVFRLEKVEKRAPNLIAKDLETNCVLPDFLKEVKASGPYLNFKIKPSIILNNIFELQEDYGRIYEIDDKDKFKSLKIVIEYPAPNTNKPLHLGHVRNMFLGNSLANLLRYIGHKVFEVNLNNDRGIHISKSMIGYKMRGINDLPEGVKPDHFVGLSYVKYNLELQKNEELNEEATTLLKLWEAEDPETRALWKKMNNWALAGFKETYKNFGISFDKEYFESNLYKKGKEIILDNVKKGVFNKTENGAVIALLKDKYKIPDKILLRSDGTSVYITQDIYLAFIKKEDFDYDRSIYVVGNEQDLYFKQLFAVLDMIGFKEDKYHLSYGMISLPEGKMKSREGTVVDADDIFSEIQNLAYNEVDTRYPEITKKEKESRANIIGMSALKFFILKFNPKSDFIFNPKESVSFEGETGPYILYVFSRIKSIFFKSREKITSTIQWDLLNEQIEQNLIKHLNYFPEIVNIAAKKYNFHLIPQYLLTICQIFNSFYSICPVISDNKELERARLFLIKCVQIVIKIGLNILGIKYLDRM